MRAEIDGAELYYEVHGDPDDPAVVSLHGGPGISDHSKGKQAFEPLTDEYQLVVYDHRGCGQSELAPPYSNEQYAADAEGLRQHLDLGEIVLIGGSYGGFIAQEYATRYEDTLAGVVLRDTAATPEFEEAAQQNAKETFPEMKERDFDVPDISWEEFTRVMDGNVRSDEEFRRGFHGMLPLYAPSLDEFDAEAAREQIESLTFHHETHNEMFTNAYPNMDYTPDLPDVSVPFLVTVGRHDWITPPAAAVEIADLLPDSRLVVFESSGHSPNLDQQDQYIARVREFFAEIDYGTPYGGGAGDGETETNDARADETGADETEANGTTTASGGVES
jgi:proline iminopeptidase